MSSKIIATVVGIVLLAVAFFPSFFWRSLTYLQIKKHNLFSNGRDFFEHDILQ